MSRPHALTPDDVLKVRVLRRAGWSFNSIGRLYGVRRWTIQDALAKRRHYRPDSTVMQEADRLALHYASLPRGERPWWGV